MPQAGLKRCISLAFLNPDRAIQINVNPDPKFCNLDQLKLSINRSRHHLEKMWERLRTNRLSLFPVLRIRDPVPFSPRDPGMGKKTGSGSGINNPDHISQRFKNNFLMRIRDPGWKKFGSGINIPDPQHCSFLTCCIVGLRCTDSAHKLTAGHAGPFQGRHAQHGPTRRRQRQRTLQRIPGVHALQHKKVIRTLDKRQQASLVLN